MQTPGRNALCSCGSGRKYKRCCAKRAGNASTSPQAAPAPAPLTLPAFFPRALCALLAKTGPMVSGTLARDSRTGDQLVMIVDPFRALVLHQLLLASLDIAGNVAECGVYKGGTALVLAGTLRDAASSKALHLFDSFQGLPDTLPVDGPHRAGHFGDASLALLRRRLEGFHYEVHPGFFSDTLASVSEHTFCFVHIDVDIYSSAVECTEWFYPRVPPGGVIVYDDYGFESTQGVRLAVDEFYARRPEHPIVMPTAQCLVIKR